MIYFTVKYHGVCVKQANTVASGSIPTTNEINFTSKMVLKAVIKVLQNICLSLDEVIWASGDISDVISY